MCTLTWWHEGVGYHLFFNRDERLTRARERPPRFFSIEGESVMAPQDGDHEGTWLAVNGHGECYALLNYYDRMATQPEPRDPVSRGVIPFRMAARRKMDLDHRELERFRPFHLVKVAPRQEVAAWRWDGVQMEQACPESWEFPFLTTSSYDSARVVEGRKEAFRQIWPVKAAEQLARFHRGTSVEGGAYGVRMRRDDAQTMSILQVRVSESGILMRYEPQPRPGEAPTAASELRLEPCFV